MYDYDVNNENNKHCRIKSTVRSGTYTVRITDVNNRTTSGFYRLNILIETASITTSATNVIYNSNTGHWYQFVACAKTWTDAKTFAENHGGHLVTITSEAENQFLVDNGNTYSWIGFTDEAEEGNWQWVTRETVSYTNWGRQQPRK